MKPIIAVNPVPDFISNSTKPKKASFLDSLTKYFNNIKEIIPDLPRDKILAAKTSFEMPWNSRKPKI